MWLGAAVIAVAGGFALVELSANFSLVLIAAIAFTLFAPLVWRASTGRFDLFEPIVAFAIAFAIMFVVRPIAMVANGEYFFHWVPGINLEPSFERMLLLVLIGSIAFVVGYHLPLGRRLADRAPRPPANWNANTVVLLCLAASAFGLFLFGLFIMQAGGASALELILRGRSLGTERVVREGSSYFILGALVLVGATLAVFSVGLHQRRRGLIVLAIVLAVGVLVVWSSFGSRIAMGPLIAALGILFYLNRDRRPGILIVVAFAVVALFASTIVATERTADVRGQKSKLQIAGEILQDPSLMIEPVLTGADNSNAPGLTAAVAIIPQELPYTYGVSSVGDFLIRPVPRNLWPEKPRSPREKVIAEMTPEGFQSNTANPTFSNLIVFYRDFGLFGGLALILYGVLFRALYEWFRQNKNSVPAQVLFALVIPMIVVACRDDPVDAFALTIVNLVPIWLVFRFGGSTARSLRPATEPSPAAPP